MSSNASIDFLEMLKGGSLHPTVKRVGDCIAVIDTETNWRDEVMSIGVAVADAQTFKCVDTRYYIIDPEYRVGGIYSNVLRYSDGKRDIECAKEIVLSRKGALGEIDKYLKENGITKIFAYNGKFDLGHLKELSLLYYD